MGKVYVWDLVPIRLALISSFHRMNQLGLFLLPLDEMLVHRRVTAGVKFARPIYTFIHMSEQRHRESKVQSCARKQHNVPNQG